MRKMMALALLAATALPALASAQDWRGGDRHSGRGEQRAPAAQAPAPQQAQPQAQPQSQRGGFDGGRRFDRAPRVEGAPQQAPAFQRPEMRDGGRRFDRGQGFNGGQAWQGRPQQENRFGNDPRRVEGGRGFVGQPQVPFQNRQGYDAPRNAYQSAPSYRGNPYRAEGGRANYGGGYRPEYNRGGEQWNRGWRNDRRYDWNSYRRGHDELFRLPRYSAPYGWRYGYERFGVGFVLEESLFARDYWIDDPYEYRLPPVDGPYRWVRYYGDALLVDIYSGEVVDTVYGIFG